MEPSTYVALSGQLALQRRLDTIANNVANSVTPGFRAENVTFESLLSQNAVAYASTGSSTFARGMGQVNQTSNPLDLAIQGDAFFSISTPSGTTYTRDGRLRLSQSGDLETLEGYPVLDVGGGGIQINPARGPVVVDRSGAVSQNGERVAAIGLYSLPPDANLTRGPGAGFTSDKPGEQIVDFSRTGVLQGYVESANVNPVLEMTRLISVSRAFDALSTSVDQADRKLSEAIRTLGSGHSR